MTTQKFTIHTKLNNEDVILHPKTEVSQVEGFTQSVNGLIDTAVAGKADASSVYTKTEVNNALSNKVSTGSADYIKSAAVNNNVLTLTKGDDTTISFQGGGSGGTGASNSASKLFLIGTTAQTEGTTYSNANVYATNGSLHVASMTTEGNVVIGGTADTNYIQLPSGIKLY